MKVYDLTDIDRNIDTYLKITDEENFFNVNLDARNKYVFNLNSTIYFDISSTDNLLKFQLTHDMHWPLISYKIYGTTRLVWLLLKINNIKMKDVFKLRKAGEIVNYISKDMMNQIIRQINGFDND